MRVQELGCRLEGLGFGIPEFEIWGLGLGSGIESLGFRAWGLEFGV